MDHSSVQAALVPRPLGQTGLHVSPLALGCAPLGNIPTAFPYEVPEERALAVIRATFQSPITFLDTGASYGDGESERRIGMVLRELGGVPDGYVVATKADRDMQTGDFSGEQIERSIERSLKLLGMDRFPLLYLHDPEHTTFEAVMAPGGPMAVLQRYQQQGLIGHLGVAGGPIDMLIQYVETGLFEAVITHNRFTLLNREAVPLLDRAAALGVAVVNAAPYGGGMLAKGPEAYPRYRYRPAPTDLLARAGQMAALCQEAGVPLAAAALQFSLRDPRVSSTIVGMTHVERLAETVALATHAIPDDLWPRLDTLTPAA
jgi:D-threo-aldose 1-dehydrogenase